jgi:hypothetical protein
VARSTPVRPAGVLATWSLAACAQPMRILPDPPGQLSLAYWPEVIPRIGLYPCASSG